MTTPPVAAARIAIDFDAIFEVAPNAYLVVDRAFNIIHANAAYRRITGARPEDILDKPLFQSFPNGADPVSVAATERLRASFERVFATGEFDELHVIPYRVARKLGDPLEDRVWSASNTPLRDASGAVVALLHHTVDITELRRAVPDDAPALGAHLLSSAERAQQSSQRFQDELRDLRWMFGQAPGFMCVLRGPNHVFEVCNAAYHQLVGHREIVGKTMAEAMPEVVSQGFVDLLDGVYADNEAFVGRSMPVMLQRTPGGEMEQAWVDLVYQPMRGLNGEPIGIFVQGNDVTQQRLSAAERDAFANLERGAREAALLIEERHRFLAESIPVQVWTARADGSLDFVSQRVLEYFRATRDEVLGAGWQGVIHPDDLAPCLALWSRSLASGEPYEVEFRLRRGDGAYRWHLGRAVAQRDASGVVLRWFGSNTDIDEARTALAELAARVEYEQRLIGIVSHDLRNPLNTIGLGAAVLELGALDAKQAKTVSRIAAAAARAGRLIQDLLGFAVARVGTSIPINPRPTNLREVIEQVVDEARLGATARIVRVEHSGEELGSWDADRIAQVLSNLLGNAMQHAGGDAPIVVASRIDNDNAVLSVSNGGPPIPADELPTLFEPFKRGSTARETSGRSVGLGLYIAREVVVAHGGTLSVASADDTGTCFTVRMPRYARLAIPAAS